MKDIGNLKNRFENFDPEIDDSIIDANWIKLKSVIENDNKDLKKAGWMFFISIFILCLATSSLIAFFCDNKSAVFTNKKNINSNKIKQNISVNSILKMSGFSETDTYLLSTEDSGNIYNAPFINEIMSNGEEPNSPDRRIRVIKSHNNFADTSLFEITKKKLEVELNQFVHSQQKQQHKNVLSTNRISESSTNNSSKHFRSGYSESSKEIKESEAVTNSTLSSTSFSASGLVAEEIFWMMPRRNCRIDFYNNNQVDLMVLRLMITDSLSIQKDIHKPFFDFELFTGVNFGMVKINDRYNDKVIKQQAMNASYGINLNYHLSKKITFFCQVLYHASKIDYSANRTELVYFSKKTNMYLDPNDSTTILMDTSKSSLNYQVNQSLLSKKSYNFGLGINYLFMKFKKIDVEAGLSFNLKNSKYDYSYESRFDSDTIKVTSGSSVITNTATSVYFSQNADLDKTNPVIRYYSKNKAVLSFGLMPSLTVTYSLNRRLNVFARPSFLFDFPIKETEFNNLFYKMRENNLLIYVGLRVKIK